MKCPKCGGENLIIENLGNGTKKFSCQGCGHGDIQDSGGRKMLTDEMPSVDRRKALVEDWP